MSGRPHLAWRLLGALAERGSRLPLLAGLALALVLAPWPRPVADRPGEAALAPDAAEQVEPPEVQSLEAILEQKAPGLGLELRQNLARALYEESNAAKLDPLLVLAVMRVESEFDEDALSVRGARGLMQLRPSTLSFLAQREGLRLPLAEIEQDPVLSTRLAVRYLARLVKSFHGDLDKALMAYNAGPHRIHVAVKARDSERLDRLASYPRRVRRAYRRLRALPPADDLTVAESQPLVGFRDGE